MVFAGLCLSLGNLQTLAAFEKQFCRVPGDNVGHSLATLGQNCACALCEKHFSKRLCQAASCIYLSINGPLKFIELIMSRCDICWGLEIQEVFVAVINYVGSCFSLVLLNKGRSGFLAKAQKHRGAVQGKVIFLELFAKCVQGFLEG